MYGGHITDDWDRRLCKTYLEEFIKPEMLEGEFSLAPGFPLPGNLDYNGYHLVTSLLPFCSSFICSVSISLVRKKVAVQISRSHLLLFF